MWMECPNQILRAEPIAHKLQTSVPRVQFLEQHIKVDSESSLVCAEKLAELRVVDV